MKPSPQTWHSIQTAGRLLEMETHFFWKWKQSVSFGIEFLKVIYVYSLKKKQTIQEGVNGGVSIPITPKP